MIVHSRRLPHAYPENRDLFLTFHLQGSLPHALYPPPGKLNRGQAFVWMDRYLDRTTTGPMYLRQPAIARLVADLIRRGVEMGQYALHAWVVMSNHVHLLVTPRISPSRFMQSLKGFTAREANRLLGLSGEGFWQRESYDHCVRDGREWDRIKAYIENNPVQAGLVADAAEYPWSSAAARASA